LNQVLAVLVWWLTLEAIGWAAWPLTATFLRGTASRGAAFAKHLGLLLTGYLLWLLVSLGILENSRAGILLVLLLVAGASLFAVRRERLLDLWRTQRQQILASEALFLVAFLGYLAFRAYEPAIKHTEQPMNLGLLNAILGSRTFPPHDMWLSGHAISYYYFGHVLMAAVTKLASVPSGVAYNLALGTIFALTVVGAYGLVSDLTASVAANRRQNVAFGLLGSVMVAVLGNLAGFLELVRTRGIGDEAFWRWINIPALAQAPVTGGWIPGTDWWWWRATRLIQDVNPLGLLPEVITEFPSFSFLLGDLHPHVMALPFGLLALAVGWDLLRTVPALPRGQRVPLCRGLALTWPALPPLALLVPLIVGALGFMNSWDLPTYLLIVVAAYAIGRAWRYRAANLAWAGETLGFGLLALVFSLALYLPFYVGFRSQVGGLGVVFYTKTPWLQYTLIFGPFLAVLVPWLAGEGLALVRRPQFLPSYAVALVGALLLPLVLAIGSGGLGSVFLALLGSAIQAPWLALALALLVALSATLLWLHLHAAKPSDAAPTFVLLLAVTALLLTLGTEFVFIRDSFGTRMNTMFKLYYQAWALLGIAAAWGIAEIARRARTGKQVRATIWLGAVAILLVAGLYYPVAAASSKAGFFAGQPTLDGTAWLDPHSGEAAAIAWLGRNAEDGAVIVEATGDSYNSSHSRVSTWTGLPTVLGWIGHQSQWGRCGAELNRRRDDVAALYQAADPGRARQILDRYGIDYVYVGPHERQKYGISQSNLAILDRLMDRVYERDGVLIYRRRH